MKITANRHPKEQNHVIISGFSFKKIKEKIDKLIDENCKNWEV